AGGRLAVPMAVGTDTVKTPACPSPALACLLFLAAAVPAALGSPPGGRRDALLTTDGRRIRVEEVLLDAAPEVRYRVGGGERSIRASSVLRVEYGDEPPALRRAREELAAGRPDVALRALAAARGARGVRPWLSEALAFESAEASEAWGAVDPRGTKEAEEGYGTFAEAYPSSRRVPASLLGRARCLRALRRFGEALAVLDAAGRDLAPFGEEAGLDLRCACAETLLAAGRPGEAREALRSLEEKLVGSPVGSRKLLLARARGAEGDCLLAEGKTEEAITHFRRLA